MASTLPVASRFTRRLPATRSTFAFPVATCVTRRARFKRVLHGGPAAVETGTEEVELDDVRQVPLGLHDLLRVHAGERGVVLVDALQRHPVRRRAGRLRERRPPGDVSFVE